MLRSKYRSGYLEFGQKKHSSLLRTISVSKICRGDALASQIDKQALVSVDRNSVSLSDNRIVKAAMLQKQMSSLEEELKNTKVRLEVSETERNRMIAEVKSVNDSLLNSKKEIESRDNQISLLRNQLESVKVSEVKLGELKRRILELEDEVEKTKQSESNMLESLMLQTRQIEQTKMDLEESRLEVRQLNKELKLQLSSDEQVARLRKEINQLNQELASQKDAFENLRLESEESIVAWTAKEMGFISCIKKAYEENAALTRENNKLHEALVASENTTRITREEASKLRDLVKQSLNESSAAKEASNIARAENSELKDLLAEKEESLSSLTKENERLRINEVAARENLKEFKRLLAAKTEANKPCEDKEHAEHTEVFNSPVASLYEDHLDGRTTHQQMFSFDFDELKMSNKEKHNIMFDSEDEHAETFVDVDPEKDEALKGSIFDTDASPKSEPRTPKAKAHHRRNATGYADGSGQFQEADHHGHHAEDGEDKGYYLYGLYHRKKLFKKIGELVYGKTTSKKEGSIEQGKEQVKEQSKEHGKEPSKEQVKEQSKEQES